MFEDEKSIPLMKVISDSDSVMKVISVVRTKVKFVSLKYKSW